MMEEIMFALILRFSFLLFYNYDKSKCILKKEKLVFMIKYKQKKEEGHFLK
jgi:hypothetical protein